MGFPLWLCYGQQCLSVCLEKFLLKFLEGSFVLSLGRLNHYTTGLWSRYSKLHNDTLIHLGFLSSPAGVAHKIWSASIFCSEHILLLQLGFIKGDVVKQTETLQFIINILCFYICSYIGLTDMIFFNKKLLKVGHTNGLWHMNFLL